MIKKFRVWSGGEMHTPDQMGRQTYRYLLDQRGQLFGLDMHDMHWDGMIKARDTYIMSYIDREDLEGNEIYEGDVVALISWTGQEQQLGVVEYSAEDCGYLIRIDDLHYPFSADPACIVLGHKFEERMQRLLKEQRERKTAEKGTSVA